MKAYILRSFDTVKQEVDEWLNFFASHGVKLRIKVVSIVPILYPDEEIPTVDEIGFEPVLIGEYSEKPDPGAKRKIISYDEYFRVEEMFFTGRYKWKTSALAGTYEEKEIEKLSSAMTIAMLEDWAAYLRKDHIIVKWELIK